MKKNIVLDHINRNIKISKDFERKASNAESTEYRLLQTIKADYPDYSISSGVIRKKENKESYRGLTYSYMERYIKVKGTTEDMEEYLDMLFLSECHKVKYPAIKRWFLSKYPDVVRYGVKDSLISDSQCAA